MFRRAAIITAFDPFSFRGGIETYTFHLVNLLKEYNINSDIYHIGLIEKRKYFHNDYLERLYFLGKKFLDIDKDYDFIIANAFYGLGYFPPRIKTYNIYHLTHMGFAEAIKNIVSLPQYMEWKYLWGEFAESISGFERIKIAVSDSVGEELGRYYGFSDVTIVENGINIDIFVNIDKIESRKKYGIPEDAFVGLYVGRWDVLKGSDILEDIITKSQDVYWVMVIGTGSDRKMIPFRKNVSVIGEVKYERMNEIYSLADFMLFTSRYEGFGYVIIEAMACKLPVITANVGVAKTIYKQEPFYTLLLPELSTERDTLISSCIEKIELLKKDKELKSYISIQGRLLVEERYTLTRWKKQMSKVLEL